VQTKEAAPRPRDGGLRHGTIWAWTNARWVTFFYSPTGDSASVRRFLGTAVARTVQCDGTSTTNFLERAGGKRSPGGGAPRGHAAQAMARLPAMSPRAIRK
jgi:hypothetical protein